MWSLPSRIGLLNLSSLGSDVPPYLLAAIIPSLITGLTVYLGGRHTANAQLQTALNDAFRSLTAELQTQHAQLIARILEAEKERDELLSERNHLLGDNRGLRQLMDSLIRFVERSGSTLPKDLQQAVENHTHE